MEVIYLDTATGKKATKTIVLEDLNNVDTTDVAEGYILVYDSTTGKWVVSANSASTTDADTLDGLDSTQFLRSDTSDEFSGTSLRLYQPDTTLSGVLLALTQGDTTARITPKVNRPAIELSGVTSSMLLTVQDGNGRIQLKWNATAGTSETFLVSSENAGMWEFNPYNTSDIFSVKFADGSTASSGDAITWTELFSVGTTNITFLSNEIVRCLTTAGFKIWVGTQADYDALDSYDSNTIYFTT